MRRMLVGRIEKKKRWGLKGKKELVCPLEHLRQDVQAQSRVMFGSMERDNLQEHRLFGVWRGVNEYSIMFRMR